MAFISVFDVLGPNMIGPSSSHTAGAEIIAFLAQKMIAPPLKRVDFTLYGSFAKTYHGHGTDRALLGGIMGFSADDTRIRDSFAIATERGLAYSFTPNEAETDIHPNTVDIRMENAAGQVMTVRGESLGGGKVRIVLQTEDPTFRLRPAALKAEAFLYVRTPQRCTGKILLTVAQKTGVPCDLPGKGRAGQILDMPHEIAFFIRSCGNEPAHGFGLWIMRINRTRHCSPARPADRP